MFSTLVGCYFAPKHEFKMGEYNKAHKAAVLLDVAIFVVLAILGGISVASANGGVLGTTGGWIALTGGGIFLLLLAQKNIRTANPTMLLQKEKPAS